MTTGALFVVAVSATLFSAFAAWLGPSLPRLREHRLDDGHHAGDRYTAAVHQLRAQQPGAQRDLIGSPVERRYALPRGGLQASEGVRPRRCAGRWG